MTTSKLLSSVDELDHTAQEEYVRVCRSVRKSLEEQYEMNGKRTSFLDQPMIKKEFESSLGMSIEEAKDFLARLEDSLQGQKPVTGFLGPLRKIAAYQKKVQDDLKQAPNFAGNGRHNLAEAELLVNMIVSDFQRMLLERVLTVDHGHGHRPTASDDSSGFPILDNCKDDVMEGPATPDDLSDFPILHYYENGVREKSKTSDAASSFPVLDYYQGGAKDGLTASDDSSGFPILDKYKNDTDHQNGDTLPPAKYY